MKVTPEKKPIHVEFLGTTPGHTELLYPRQAHRRSNMDLFALASSLGWSSLETDKLRDVYGIALGLDQASDMGQELRPAARSTSK